MTDKELRKLSRLEILEILLEESKENERLRAELEEIKSKGGAAEDSKSLYETTERMSSALAQVDSLVRELQKITKEGITVKTHEIPSSAKTSAVSQSYPMPPKKDKPPMDESTKQVILSDRKLYWRMMHFYAQNEMALAFLPPDIQNDVRTRLRGILDARK